MLAAKFRHAGGIAHLVEQAFGRTASIVASFIFLGAVLLGLPSIALTGGYYFESAFSSAFSSVLVSAATSFLFFANSVAIFLLCLAGGLNLCAPRTAKKIRRGCGGANERVYYRVDCGKHICFAVGNIVAKHRR